MPDDDKSTGIEFALPPGWQGFDGTEEGKDRDFICTIKLKGPGRGCLVALEGNPVEKSVNRSEKVIGPEEDRESRYRQ